ncbi:M56 family metallopeptidase [Sphingopyxis sp.]|uniref:M56 family metallopeptidase n=1 Tax=Sphingopyxis sp. TaxID=1908224 RepID=UPI003D0A5D5D
MMITTATLIGLVWKSALIAGLTLALLRLARTRSAGERSLVAHVGLLALLVLPFATMMLPQWQPLPTEWAAAAPPVVTTAAPVAAPADDAAVSAAASVPATAETGQSLSVVLASGSEFAPFFYLVPLALLFAVMLLAVLRLFAMRGRAEVLVEGSWLSALAEAQRRMGFKHGTALLVSDELRSPISWGLLRSTIVLSPKAVQAVGEAEAIIAHELAHIARLDWAKLLASRAACAVFWFNPLVWMLARESHQLREEAADDAVLMADIDGPDYATLLVGAARHDNKAALMAAHGVAPSKNSLKRRITRVLDASLKRGPASASWVLMSLVLLAGVTAPLAAFSATAAQEQATAEQAFAADSRTVAVAARQSALTSSQSAVASRDAAEDSAAQAAASSKQLTPEQLISMRAVGVTPEDVRQMQDDRWSVDAADVIAAKATGIDGAYIGQMRRLFPGAEVGEMIGAAAVGVDVAYARDIKAYFPGVNLDDLTGMRAVGVDSAFIREMRKAGVVLRDPEDAIALRATGGIGRAARAAIPEPPAPVRSPAPVRPPEPARPPAD